MLHRRCVTACWRRGCLCLGFLRLNTNGGVTPPVLEGRVMYIAGDEVYEL